MKELDKDVVGAQDVINGVPTSSDIWPATRAVVSNEGSCTSTVVGEQVLLTAAHCLPDGGTIEAEIEGLQVQFDCEHHPEYVTDHSLDFALCKTSQSIDGFYFERINTSIAYPQVGSTVVLLGYGCVTAGGHDGSFGTLFQGTGTVASRPSSASAYIVTTGPSAVCYGDSGGASYYLTSNDQGIAKREIIGLNSRGDIDTDSYISATATSQFISWATDWSDRNNVRLCGIHAEAKKCR
ncbi:MAG: trypsin-like serine protease [Pseudomonadota bacterium]